MLGHGWLGWSGWSERPGRLCSGVLKLLVPFLLLLGVVGVSVLSDKPLPKADFTFINRGDVTTLDLQRMSWMQDFRVAKILWEGLVRQDVFSHDYAIRGAAAQRWEESADGTRYTFYLRPEAKWSNGEPLKASDFVYSWRRALLPEAASDYVGQVQLVKGGAAFTAWRGEAVAAFAKDKTIKDRPAAAAALWRETLAKFDELVGMRALDDHTLVVELERPTPYFLDMICLATFYPVYPPLIERFESLDPETGQRKFESGWTKPPYLISNGPFKLTLWRFKRDMRLEANEFYWNRAALNIESIAIPSVADGNAAVLAFKSGAVDWTTDVTPEYKSDMLADKRRFYQEHQREYDALVARGLDQIEIDRHLPSDPRKNIHAIPAFGTYFYNFNCLPKLRDGRDNPFFDARVRKAFSMAIDRKSICDNVRRTGEPPAGSLIPPGSIGGYTSPKGVVYDPAGARKLLAEAGYPDPSRFMTVQILFNKDAGHDKIAQAVAKNWQQNLGVSVSLEQKEVTIIRDDLKNANYMVSRGSWYGDYGDPTTFLDLSRTGDGNNDRKYSNAKFDALLDRAAMERDTQRRLDILAEAERMLVEDELPVLPIFHYAQIYLFDADRVSGLSAHPRQDQKLDLIDMLGDGKGAEKSLSLPPRPPSAGGPGDRAVGS